MRQKKSMPRNSNTDKSNVIIIFIEMILIVFIIALAGYCFIRLKDNSGKISSDIEEENRKIESLKCEIANLNLDIESKKSGRHIFREIKRWKLKLREPQPGEVRRILPNNTWMKK